MKTHAEGSLFLTASIVAIGAFDGVHQGHQAVIREAVNRSRELKVPSVVFTFDPPPRNYFQGVQMLTPIDEKLQRLAELGVEHAIVAKFNTSYAKRSSSRFIQGLARLNPLEIMVGEDFRFGRNREGDVSLLSQFFQVQVTEPVCCSGGKRISSTRIRELIAQGDLQQSHSLLGWPVGEKEGGACS
ncbi:FAD synthetase [Ammoniphilus sp. CFH 90114]|uniref:FAD synthetase n=1 Tax=Ammoniphilus sp. CFH 90114 TaxID=2493665 RepID=UPI00100EBC6C|nr:FAD synthetase [Ammoniphilus sp. CFH 90114]RXT13475.1 FAD synthetase [Ammoniphilus sp. CFH 90114]